MSLVAPPTSCPTTRSSAPSPTASRCASTSSPSPTTGSRTCSIAGRVELGGSTPRSGAPRGRCAAGAAAQGGAGSGDLHHHLRDVEAHRGVADAPEQLLREMRAGLELSDRRAVKGLKAVAGAALLAGREEATLAESVPLIHVWFRVADAPILRGLVEPRVVEAGGAPADARARGRARGGHLELLEAQARQLRGETAVGAHLMALNRLRREAMVQHPRTHELRARIDAAVHRIMAQLEAAHV